MRKLILFMHVSLDGFVAGPNGEMDFLHVDEEIFDYVGDRVDSIDTPVYGRKTWEMMEGYWPTAGDAPNASKHDIHHSQWYKEVHKVVLSKSLKGQDLRNVTVIGDDIKAQFEKLKQGPGNDMVIFGSPSAAHALMEHNLIDGYWLFVNPILIGNGIPFFKNVQQRTALRLVSAHSFSSGVISLDYNRAE